MKWYFEIEDTLHRVSGGANFFFFGVGHKYTYTKLNFS